MNKHGNQLSVMDGLNKWRSKKETKTYADKKMVNGLGGWGRYTRQHVFGVEDELRNMASW